MTHPAVAPDTLVTLSYVLFDEKGADVDHATPSDPLSYVHGYAQIVPGLERGVEGMKVGERRTLIVAPEHAFGDRDEEGVFEVDRAEFPNADEIAPGDEFVAESPDGHQIAMRVVEVRADALVVDSNHPLAGHTVRFEVEVKAVRPATEDEIAEAQADVDELLDDADGCGCGHEHGEHGHDDVHVPTESLLRAVKKS